jgi:N-acyl-D-aspartate/D-glutamate deacylase
MLSVVGGAAVNWNPMVYTGALPDLWKTNLSASAEAADAGGRVYAVWNPGSNGGTRVDLKTCFLFMALPHWREVATRPLGEKVEAFGDPAVRRVLAHDLEHDQSLGALTARLRTMWDVLRVTEAKSSSNQAYVGRTVAEIARDSGRTPLDAMLDIAVADDLETVFMQDDARAETDGFREAFAALAGSPYVLFGGTDAGAHLDMLSNESLYARTIQRRVRDEGVLTLEEVIRRFTGGLADAIGLRDRGRIAPGQAADLAVFDLARIGAGDTRLARDLPGGCERLVTEARGVHHVIVNGEILLSGNEATGARPGRLLRSGAMKSSDQKGV